MAGRTTKSGRVQVMVTLDPAQLDALRDEAIARARRERSGRPDASAVLREIVDGWLRRKASRKPKADEP